MTQSFETGLAPGVARLAQSAAYLLGSLSHVTYRDLGRRTPCDGWDLGTLLRHVADSADASGEVLAGGPVSLSPPPALVVDPVRSARNATQRLLATCRRVPRSDVLCDIGDRALWTSTAVNVGAVELAVHGWDIAASVEIDRQMTDGLATGLRRMCRQLITDPARGPEFGEQVRTSPTGTATDLLVGFLGRSPSWRA